MALHASLIVSVDGTSRFVCNQIVCETHPGSPNCQGQCGSELDQELHSQDGGTEFSRLSTKWYTCDPSHNM